MITGRLRDSVVTKFVGDGTVLVGATTPYARIQQFGGYSGVNRATRTPARPYLEAALAESSGEAWDAAIDVIVERVFGG
jgi:phage gpG-like protein